MTTTQKLTLDIQRKGELQRVDVVQGDSFTRQVDLVMQCGGKDWMVPDCDAVVRYCKPDGTQGIYDTLPDGTPGILYALNTITVELAPQMLTCPGVVQVQVELLQQERKLATFPFLVVVEPGVAPAGESEDYVNWSKAFLPQTTGAKAGQYLKITQVDDGGRIIEMAGVDSPADEALIKATTAIQIANEVSQEMKAYSPSGTRSIAEAASRTASEAMQNVDEFSIQLQDQRALIDAKLPMPETAAIGQYFRVKEIDAAGLVTAVETVDAPSGDSLAIVSPETAQVGQTIVVKSVDENGKPTAWEAADFPKSNTSHVWETEPTTEEVSEITYNLGNSLELSNQLVNADTVVLTIHLKAPAAESTDATKRGVVNAGIYIPQLMAWGWIPFKDAEACPIPAISYSLTTDLEAIVIHAGKEKAVEAEGIGWLRRYGLQLTAIYPKNQNIINGGTQINGLSAYKVTPDTIRDMELKVTSSTPIGVGSYVRLEAY